MAVIAIGATAVYITQRQGDREVAREKEVATIPKTPKKPVVQPEELTTTDPLNTSDWNVYHNERYGFAVRYPKDWATSIDPGDGKGVSFYNPDFPLT